MPVKLQQNIATAKKLNLDKISNWIMIFPEEINQSYPYASVFTERRKATGSKKTDTSPVVCDLPNKQASHVALACIKQDISSFALLTLARKLVAEHNAYKAKEMGVSVAGFDEVQTERIAEAIIAAILTASAEMPSFKSKKKPAVKLSRITIYGIRKSNGFKRTFAEAEGNALARSLSMLPSNKLTPSIYLRRIKELARDNKWKLEFYDTKALQKKKAGAFLAVSQGSPTADAGIVRLHYKPTTKTRKDQLTLVGKGICYDTGGTNLKPANYMFGMHEDMQGSAVALGTFLALTRMKVNFPVECWLALAMNHIGPKAYKPNDVVTASDGTTIEIVHTDAEGRMVLADTLALASKLKPKLMIDYATLTGACMYSLGTAYSGAFTNKEEFIPTLIEAGKDSGERVWSFPMDEDFDKAIESDIADVKQCSLEAGMDHILASRFLQRFVKNDTPWIHIDLSSSNRKGGLAHIPTDTTGFGIRFTLNFLLDKKMM
ncbi:MAG: leucyl aminopeptidase family protein [Gammaproteobacteria bacterium]|nr:MAG: leucyl aminopeptidase family protein [Gammaproteobacteria bacterium]